MQSIPYQEMIGSLMYAAISTCPDIMYAVQTLSQHLEDPGPAHWTAAKRVLRYLKGTVHHGLTYHWKESDKIIPLGHSDAD